jgi:hypothetical protein
MLQIYTIPTLENCIDSILELTFTLPVRVLPQEMQLHYVEVIFSQ